MLPNLTNHESFPDLDSWVLFLCQTLIPSTEAWRINDRRPSMEHRNIRTSSSNTLFRVMVCQGPISGGPYTHKKERDHYWTVHVLWYTDKSIYIYIYVCFKTSITSYILFTRVLGPGFWPIATSDTICIHIYTHIYICTYSTYLIKNIWMLFFPHLPGEGC